MMEDGFSRQFGRLRQANSHSIGAKQTAKMTKKTPPTRKQARSAAYRRPASSEQRSPLAVFPQPKLNYLGNVYNAQAAAFYQDHGVSEIAPAYECNQQPDEVSLMITKHCLRYSFNQCPKEREPGFKPDHLVLKMGKEAFRLKFDCKRCEMHVLGKLKQSRSNGK